MTILSDFKNLHIHYSLDNIQTFLNTFQDEETKKNVAIEFLVYISKKSYNFSDNITNILNYLTSLNININQKNSNGQKAILQIPMDDAMGFSFLSIDLFNFVSNFLIDNGAVRDDTDDYMHLLKAASEANNIKVTKFILDKTSDHYNLTSLILIAIEHKSIDVIKYFININKHLINKNLIKEIIKIGNEELIKLSIKIYIKSQYIDKDDFIDFQRSLMETALKTRNIKIVQLLLDNNIKIYIKKVHDIMQYLKAGLTIIGTNVIINDKKYHMNVYDSFYQNYE